VAGPLVPRLAAALVLGLHACRPWSRIRQPPLALAVGPLRGLAPTSRPAPFVTSGQFPAVTMSPPLLQLPVPLPTKKRLGRGALVVAAVAAVTAVLPLATAHLGALADGFARVLHGPSCYMPAYVAAGAGAGALHTLSGPDHLAALAPLALRVHGGPGAAFRTGALWGSSHVLGQLLLGLGLLAVGRCSLVSGFLASAGAGAAAERLATLAVGSILILIGGLGLKESREWDEDAENGHEVHGGPLDWRTLGTGILSGMHPDALLLCLPALALPSRLAGLAFLAAFGVGTLAAMGGYAAALHAACCALGGSAVRGVARVSSGVAVAIGGAICCSVFGGVPLLSGLL